MKKIAVFAIINTTNGVIVTTRPEDANVPFGLPGGKVDPGEPLEVALVRECFEEGVDISCCSFEKVHEDRVDDVLVHWFLVEGDYELLSDYKEKYRDIKVIFQSVHEVANSGYGNEFISTLLN